MKIEKLKNNNIWKWIGITVAISIIVFVVTFKGTKAKYRYTVSYPAVKGTINYKNGDISVLAIKLQQEDGTYLDSEDFPTSGYTLNTTESYCVRSVEGEGQVRQNVEMSYENDVFTVKGLKKGGTKCFLYFDGIPAKDVILANNTVDTSRKSGEFTSTFEEDTSGRIFEGPADDSGTDSTYFFAGSNPNNWVKFGKEETKDIYWRIIRVNSDGTVRMIYNGTSTTTTGTGTQISNNGGSTTAYAFNTSYNDNAYVGYMYGSTGQSEDNGYTNTHKNINNSTIKTHVDTWYNTNLNKTGIKEHIDTNAGFCGDRSLNTTSETWWSSDTKNGYGVQATAYGPYGRLLLNGGWRSTQIPSLKCKNNNDLYTVTTVSRGNKALTYPVGLITSDEVVFAGGFGGTANSNFWLYTNQYYWTMSSYIVDTSGRARVFYVNSSGSLFDNYVYAADGVRPVINLKADTAFSSGDGTLVKPYVVN